MKKHTASLMTAAMLLTVAWLTGCDSKELEQPAGTGTAPALETTAEPVTEAVTEAIEATEAAGQSFDDYAAFAAAMAEQHPEKTLYTPPESVLTTWTWKAIQLKADGYQYQLYNAETQETVNLLISMEPLFQNAQEIVDSMADMTDVTATLVDAGCCLCQWNDSGEYALYGITGDMGANYIVTLEHADQMPASADELTALRSEFWL